MNGVMGLRPL